MAQSIEMSAMPSGWSPEEIFVVARHSGVELGCAIQFDHDGNAPGLDVALKSLRQAVWQQLESRRFVMEASIAMQRNLRFGKEHKAMNGN